MEILKAKIIALFSENKGTQFVGIQKYTNSVGEVANYVVNVNFSYGKAVEKSIAILNSLTDEDFAAIAVANADVCNTSGIQYATNAGAVKFLTDGTLPKEGTKARETALKGVRTTKSLSEMAKEMVEKMLANQNSETKSNQSIAQSEMYERINGCVKMHTETKNVHLYALAVSKTIVVEGEYKETESTLEAKQKIAIERYCKKINKELPTTKFRNFVIEVGQLEKINAMGKEFNFAE